MGDVDCRSIRNLFIIVIPIYLSVVVISSLMSVCQQIVVISSLLRALCCQQSCNVFTHLPKV